MPLLECRALEVGYRGEPVLPPITLALEPGSFNVVVGRNGSGKTTWLRTVLGLLPPVRGQLVLPVGVRLAYLPQRLVFDAIFPLSARDVVAMGVLRGANFLGRRDTSALRRAMEEVDAWALRDAPFRSLSEGQKQRVLLARALVGKPGVAFMDEPTAAMDIVAERGMLDLVDRLRREHRMAVVMIHHELDVATTFAERVLLVDRPSATCQWGPPGDVLAGAAFARVYGKDKAHALLRQMERGAGGEGRHG